MKDDRKRDPSDLAAEIFADALDRAPEDRNAFLDSACEGDVSLRGEVSSLLASYTLSRGFFGTIADLAGRVTGDVAFQDDAFVGREVGAYRIVRAIAAGGMGAVYLGERVDEAFQKQVAVKLLHPGLAAPDILARFRVERQVLADLEHPGIARLIDGGTTPEGLPFLVMEFVDGIPIDEYCRETRLSLNARLALFLEVCEAVSYAHRNLVIHRDLKPSNILVDRSGRPRLLDFGIAKVLEPSRSGAGDATMVSFRALTPRYASPEQARGDRMTTATDVYSLGVILYEMLTGALPYRLDDRSPSEIERIISHQPPTRPSRAVVAPGNAESSKLSQRLSGDLDTIVLKALNKEPERRHSSVEEFAGDVRRYLAGLPVQARPDTAAYRVSKFVRRHKGLVAGVLGVVVILAAALGVTLHEYGRASARSHELQSLAYVNSLGAAESSLLLSKVGEAGRYLDMAPAPLRGWEWHHLHNRLDRSLRSSKAHAQGITRLAFSRDGKWLVSSSNDSTVKLWDEETGAAIHSWGPWGGTVESAAIDPHGRFVATGLINGDVLLLPMEKEAGKEPPPTFLHRGGDWAVVAVSPDGERIASGFFDGRVTVWNAASGAEIAAWKAHDQLAIVSYSPGGHYLVTGGSQGSVKVWDARTHALLRELRAHTHRVYSMTVSEDDRRLVTGSMDRTAIVWDLPSGDMVTTFREHRGTVGGVALQPGGNLVASAGADGQLLLWDATSGARKAQLLGHLSDISAIAADPRGSRLVTGDWSGVIKSWSWDTEDVRVLRMPGLGSLVARVHQVIADPRGRRLICITNVNPALLWPLDAAEPSPLPGPSGQRGAISEDGRWLAIGDASGHVELLDGITGDSLAYLQVSSGPILSLAMSADGVHFAAASDDSVIRLWTLTPPALAGTMSGHRGAVFDLEFSPDASALASCGEDGEIKIWTARTGGERLVLRGHQAAVRDLAWSPDGRRLVSASDDGSIRLWDTGSGRLLSKLFERRSAMLAVAFSHDGSRIAAGGYDEMVRLFDAATGTELLDLHGHVARITSLAFGPEDAFLASASYDGTVRSWDAPDFSP